MKREGKAEMGVSMLLDAPFICDDGGGGRANGFGGPVAPADSRAEADGEGGGSTGPASPSRIGVNRLSLRAGRCAEGEPEDADFSFSSSSAGIWTLSRGRFASEATLFVLDGICGTEGKTGVEAVRMGGGGGGGLLVGIRPLAAAPLGVPLARLPRLRLPTSSDCDLGDGSRVLLSELGGIWP